ncbi:MAG: LptF/LptG family permease [Rhodobiaceae bacterium]|nr:LptF/LptG family permease [Rhodobiaceae bacterium]MCC0054635.1 LptF/LptG family permease [Rhodobiaceae bacterium]
MNRADPNRGAALPSLRRGKSPMMPFGRETRYVLRLYLQRVSVAAAVIAIVVLALDLMIFLTWVMSDHTAASGLEGGARLAYYMLLRLAYILASIIPIATVVGIIWAEFALASAQERIMIANSGRPPALSLLPALLVGLILGACQYATLAYLRPASVQAQSQADFRYFGAGSKKGSGTGFVWIALNDAFVHTRIQFDEPATLRGPIVYGLDKQGRLVLTVSAEKAIPTKQSGIWHFETGSWWRAPNVGGAGGNEGMRERAFTDSDVTLALDPVWLDNFGINAKFVNQTALGHLANASSGVPEQFRYENAYQARLATIAYLVGLALMSASLGLALLGPGTNFTAALKIAGAGYAVHVLTNVFSTLGEYGYMETVVAQWLLPAGLIIFSGGYVLREHLRVRSALAANGLA